MSGSFADSIRMLAIISIAICLIPAGAHFFEMPNKMALLTGEYMIVQKIYAGWALFGIAVFAALAFTLVHTVLVWPQPKPRWLSLFSFLGILATQAIFWAYTYPMNSLTRNWTVTPDNVEAARQQWEYSRAVNAGITLLSLVLIIAAVLAGKTHDAPSALIARGRSTSQPPTVA
jgi:hypothetical protein